VGEKDPLVIPLSCAERKNEIVCRGRYVLKGSGYSSPDFMTIARKK